MIYIVYDRFSGYRFSFVLAYVYCIVNLGFKFRSKFTVHCGHGACREEERGHLVLC